MGVEGSALCVCLVLCVPCWLWVFLGHCTPGLPQTSFFFFFFYSQYQRCGVSRCHGKEEFVYDYEARDVFRVPEDWIFAQRAVECVAFDQRSLMRIPGMGRLIDK